MRYFFATLFCFFCFVDSSFAAWHQYDTAYTSECSTSSHSSCSPVPAADYGLPSNTPWRQRQSSTAQCGKADGSTGTQVNYACEYSDVDPCTSPESWQQATQSCGCPSGQVLENGACVAVCSTGEDSFAFTKPTGGSLNIGSANQCINGCSVTLTAAKDIGPDGNCGPLLSDPTITKCYFYGNRDGSHCSNSVAGAGAASAAGAVSTPTNTPTSTSTNTSTSTSPPGTVPAQSGTTVDVSSSSSSQVNSDGSITTTTTTITTTTNPDGSTSTSTKVGTSTTQGGNGKGAGIGAGTGTGSGNGAGDCDPTAKDYFNCIAGEQTPLTHTAASNAQSFGDAMNNFQDGLKQTGIGALASGAGIGGEVNIGECPRPTFEAFGRTLTIDAHCALWEQVSPMLTTVMHVVYVVMGILIILSA